MVENGATVPLWYIILAFVVVDFAACLIGSFFYQAWLDRKDGK